MNTFTIDGAQGGGQILRSALTLSLLRRQPFRIERIRAARPNPGLMRQHLACVEAAARVGLAHVEGAHLGSTALEFAPQGIAPGHHEIEIGSAGSTLLVLQTILLPLLAADGESRVRIHGATHNPMAPTADFVEHAYLGLLRRMGAAAGLSLARVGFVPSGGGLIEATLSPSRLVPPVLDERGTLREVRIEALVSGLSRDIAQRELAVVARRLRLREAQLHVVERPRGEAIGNALHAILQFQHARVVVQALGRRGLTAERVAEGLCDDVRRFLASDAAVDEHLADQLLLPLVCAGGGRFSTGRPSAHLESNARLIESFGAARIRMEPRDGDPAKAWSVQVDPLP
jgi:RNA 3'-terminal phosphate cyclase (ATP)